MHIASVTCIDSDAPDLRDPWNFWKPKSLGVRPESNGSFQNDCDAISTLSRVCKMGREIVCRAGRAIVKPVRMEFRNGTCGIIDLSADVVYFKMPSNLRALPPTALSPNRNGMENLLKAGALITTDAWHGFLRHWFESWGLVGGDEWHEKFPESLSHVVCWEALVGNMPKLEEFYLILPDISQHDWNTYDNKFPTAFHDRGGSYVVVQNIMLPKSCPLAFPSS